MWIALCFMASFAITYFFVKAIKDIGERKRTGLLEDVLQA